MTPMRSFYLSVTQGFYWITLDEIILYYSQMRKIHHCYVVVHYSDAFDFVQLAKGLTRMGYSSCWVTFHHISANTKQTLHSTVTRSTAPPPLPPPPLVPLPPHSGYQSWPQCRRYHVITGPTDITEGGVSSTLSVFTTVQEKKKKRFGQDFWCLLEL